MRKRILVVSEDRVLGVSRVGLLTKAGYQAELIASDDAAVALLEAESFDLVLLGRDSLRRGKGLDRRLRERHPQLLTLKIEGNVPVPSLYASRITESHPERVLAALEEMLANPGPGSKPVARSAQPVRRAAALSS